VLHYQLHLLVSSSTVQQLHTGGGYADRLHVAVRVQEAQHAAGAGDAAGAGVGAGAKQQQEQCDAAAQQCSCGVLLLEKHRACFRACRRLQQQQQRCREACCGVARWTMPWQGAVFSKQGAAVQLRLA
jgi:hypothetical protein